VTLTYSHNLQAWSQCGQVETAY